jgi:hypothetical protein
MIEYKVYDGVFRSKPLREEKVKSRLHLVKYLSSLVAASNKAGGSLRTTFPKELVDLFGMVEGDKVEWEFDARSGKLEAVVRKSE